MIVLLALAAAQLPFRFEPLHAEDSQPMAGVECDVTDSHRHLLLSYGDSETGTAMRIGGHLARFRAVQGPQQAEGHFRGSAGELRLRFVHPHDRGQNDLGDPAHLTFTDRRGQPHRAFVRVTCDI